MKNQFLLIGVLIVGLALTAASASLAASAAEPDEPLAPADFNGDWYADLAIGVPDEDIGGAPNAGAVNILYGKARQGLSTTNNQAWNQSISGMAAAAEAEDRFGTSLAVGDFDGDGFFDLAVGIPSEAIGSPAIDDAGAVHVLYGSASGLTVVGNEVWSQNTTGIQETAEVSDQFGNALAVGDFDGDGYDDLAVGVAKEDVGNPETDDAGAVNILYGSATGLTAADNQLWHQDIANVEGGVEKDDGFGVALAAGDFDGDGRADLAVGVRGEDVDSTTNAGAVNILYGSASGLTATGDQIWHQDSTDILDTAEAGDWFGFALTVGDFDGDDRADLAVGVPYEDVETTENAGTVNVLYGSPSGLAAVGNQLWRQNTAGVEGGAETDDYFGYALTAGDFDGDGRADLAVGVPLENRGNISNSGAVNVLYGSALGLTAAGDQIWSRK